MAIRDSVRYLFPELEPAPPKKYGIEVKFRKFIENEEKPKWEHWKWYKTKGRRDNALAALNQSHRTIAQFRAKDI